MFRKHPFTMKSYIYDDDDDDDDDEWTFVDGAD